MVKYVPDIGHIVWLSFDTQAGHEQAGRRPAIVLSLRAYNEKTGLCLLAPITSRQKGYPFELNLPQSCSTQGVVLCDQIRSLDWRIRNAEFKEHVDIEFARGVVALFLPIMGELV